MFEAYLESVPLYLNPMAIPFGETFYIEAYLRRISNCKDPETRAIFEKMGVLYATYTIVERAGEFRSNDLLTSD